MKRSTVMVTILLIVIVSVAVFYLLAKKASAPAPEPSVSNTTNTNQSDSTSTPASNADMDHSNTQQSAPSSDVSTNQVAIENFAFSPASITVKKGTSVTWTNKDSTQHSVIGDTSNGPNSGLLAQGKTYSYTFNEAGTFSYHCGPHPSMTGKVTVTE